MKPLMNVASAISSRVTRYLYHKPARQGNTMSQAMEAAERLAARPSFLLLFNLALASLWIWFGVDVANIMISIVTAELVFLGLGANRRAQLAMQAKLDELVIAGGGTRNELARLEERTEEEIEEARQ